MKRILVVDDDQQTRQIVKIFLTRQNYLVEEAENGEQALSITERVQPDLVLLNIVLPDMSGLEILQIIKRKYPELGVIMLTGLNQEAVWKKAMLSGATDYITKPFSYDQLRTNLTAHLPLKSDND